MATYDAMTRDERVSTIGEMWLNGLSAGQIAIALKTTRNVIIGMVHRNHINRERRVAVPSSKPPARAKPHVTKARAPTIPREPIMRQSADDMIASNRPPIDGIEPISLLELPNRPGIKCRFPVIGGYCGAPSGERMYCEHHHRYVYSPREADK